MYKRQDPTSVDSIQQVLEVTLADEQRINQMRQSGLMIAESFTWNKTTSDTLQVYKKLLVS